MAYGIIRVRNLSASSLRATEIHNKRLYKELDIKEPDNIRTDSPAAKYGKNRHELYSDADNLTQAINKRLEKLKIKPRSNSVLAIEYVVALSAGPKEAKNLYDAENKNNWSANSYFNECYKFIGEKHGFENIVSMDEHYDESNPHAHFLVIPISKKETHWKNATGEGTRTENRLCARDYTGGKEKLKQLQTDYHEFAKPIAKKMGLELYRGTAAEEKLKLYTKKTLSELGQIRAQISTIGSELDKATLKKQIDKISNVPEQIKKLQEEVERHFDKNSKGKWKKGISF